jgi:hypothetical protein
MANNSQHPIWELYNLQRDSRYYSKLYWRQVDFLLKVGFWSDIVTTIFAGSSAIAGFTIWKTSAGSYLWAIGAGLAAVISALKPLLKLNDRIKSYTELYNAYTDLEFDCKIIAIKVKNNAQYSQADKQAVLDAQQKARELAKKTPPKRFAETYRRAIQTEVNHELPPERFYIPS